MSEKTKRPVCIVCGKGIRGRYPPPDGRCRRCRLAAIGVVTERTEGWQNAPIESPQEKQELEPFESGSAVSDDDGNVTLADGPATTAGPSTINGNDDPSQGNIGPGPGENI